MHTPRVEKKLLLSLLSIEASLGSEEGQQMTPLLLNEAFSVKTTQQKPRKHRKEPYDTLISTYKQGMQQISW